MTYDQINKLKKLFTYPIVNHFCNHCGSILLEFGSWLGWSTYFEAENTPIDSIIICIDQWDGVRVNTKK